MADAGPKVIVITGATRGLGRAMAGEFAALGHRVLGCGRSAEEVEKLKAEHGAPHDFEAVDVADDGRVRAWAARLLAAAGPPDLLLNNAALINHNAPLWEIDRAEFDQVIAVNISGLANVIRHFAPAMVARRSGVIVNFSSYWGRSSAPEVAPYCATKWAVEGLTRALAKELPSGMAAVPFNPGIIETDMLWSTFGDQAQGYISADRWVKAAAPFLLNLGPADNGKPATAPGQ